MTARPLRVGIFSVIVLVEDGDVRLMQLVLGLAAG
jgi:hypothetical protein